MVMSNLFRYVATTVALSVVVLACTPKTVGQTEQEEVKQLLYETPIFKEDSDYIVIPVGTTTTRKDKRKILSGSGVRSDAKGAMIYNLIFYNKKENKSHLLLDKKAIVDYFEFLDDQNQESEKDEKDEKNAPEIELMLFKLIEEDTNGDESLDGRDAIVGYLSDRSGKNLKQITPKKAQLLTWHFDRGSQGLFVRIRKDSDGDTQFTANDEETFLRVDLKNPEMGQDIVGDEIQKKLKSILTE